VNFPSSFRPTTPTSGSGLHRLDRPAPPIGEYEIIVVDDKSSDEQRSRSCASSYPGIRLFANEKNIGFGKTVNVGLAAAAGEYVLVLNNDTWMHVDALDAMIGFLDTHATSASSDRKC